jgi:predicted SAM-dependent methyltransferase
MDRKDVLRQGVDKNERMLEIGASFNPVFAKRDGWPVKILDNEDRDGLIERYKNNPLVDVSVIEDVDYVCRDGAFLDAVPMSDHGSFDALLASHVVEHAPDMVGFLKAANALIKPEGCVILAIPDKRLCYDFFRPPSTTGEVLAAHIEGHKFHSRKSLFDAWAYAGMKGGHPAWNHLDKRPLQFPCTLNDALALMHRAGGADYIDVHAWVFTPSSFALLMLELGFLGFLDLHVERIEPRPDTEFFVWLKRGPPKWSGDFAETRRALLSRVTFELAEQVNQFDTGVAPYWLRALRWFDRQRRR